MIKKNMPELTEVEINKQAFLFLVEFGGKGFAIMQTMGLDVLLNHTKTPELAKQIIDGMLRDMIQLDMAIYMEDEKTIQEYQIILDSQAIRLQTVLDKMEL